jgi:hypothetical protein
VYNNPVISKFSISYILADRGPKEGFSLYYFYRKRMPLLKVLGKMVFNCIYSFFEFLMQSNEYHFISLVWNFHGVLACLRMFGLRDISDWRRVF